MTSKEKKNRRAAFKIQMKINCLSFKAENGSLFKNSFKNPAFVLRPSNVEFSLTQDCLNYTCRGNDTDEIKFVGLLNPILLVPLQVVKRRLNMK